METKIIMVLSLERSGSSNFMRILKIFKNLRVGSEIFHPKEIDQKSFDYSSSEDCVKYLLEKIKDCEKEYYFFKIFHEHLENEQIKYLINSGIIYYTIILERKNTIKRYISSRKAKLLNEWGKRDTTNIKINFDIDQYNHFHNLHLKWYKFCHNIVKNKNYSYIKYQETFNIDKCLNKIQSKIPDLILHKNKKFNPLPIQDKSKSYADKISNYKEVKEFIANQKTKLKNK